MTTANAVTNHLGSFSGAGLGDVFKVGTAGHGDPVKSERFSRSLNAIERGHHLTFEDLLGETMLDVHLQELAKKAKIDPRETLESYGKWTNYKNKEKVFRILRYEFEFNGHRLKAVQAGTSFVVLGANNKKIRNPLSLTRKAQRCV